MSDVRHRPFLEAARRRYPCADIAGDRGARGAAAARSGRSMANVAVLGLGSMGSRMALNLVRAGHAVTVWNRTSARTDPLARAGAKVAQSPRTAVAGSDYVVSMVRDDGASRSVWLDPVAGALAALPDQAVAIESSTLTVACVRELAERFEAVGSAFLDAPVAGSRPQAEAGQLIYLVGGDAAVIAAAEPILRAMGGAVHHAGAAGDGAALKLALNALFGIQIAALAEILGLLGKAGVDRARAIDIMAATPVFSPAAKAAAASMLAGAFAPMFPVALAEKDFEYALIAAGGVGATTPMIEAARHVFRDAIDRGWGDDNLTGVARLYA